MSAAFAVVEEFERAVAEFAGAKFGVAVNSGTSAIFLSLVYDNETSGRLSSPIATIPARTFISVPMAAKHAGYFVEFVDSKWTGVYLIGGTNVLDGALRFRSGMYGGGKVLHCLSFHARKLLNIGEGGMILTDDAKAAKWLRLARYSGREGPNYRIEDVKMLGWQCYMTPEKAARGLHLLEYIADDLPDQVMQYPDLRKAAVFRREYERAA